MGTRRRIAVVAVLCGVATLWLGRPALVFRGRGTEAEAQTVGTVPDGNPQSATWQHVRMDEVELAKLGGGSVEAGMNKLGAKGYELFIVTSSMKTAQAGYHFFKRPPWNKPLARPAVEYLRVDAGAIAKRGNGSFNDGLTEIERDRWELVAITTSETGACGLHYFRRPVRN